MEFDSAVGHLVGQRRMSSVTGAYLDKNERIDIERQFSLAKRKCSLGKVKTKPKETVGFTLDMLIVVLHLRKIQHTLSSLLLQILHLLWPQQKLAFVQ